jgi:hypothetical protein
MALVLEILLGVMILASLVIAYFSARTWPIYQAVLVAFVFLGIVAFFYLGARTLATHKAWGELVKQKQQDLQGLEQQTKQILETGGPDANGKQVNSVRQMRKELGKLATDRGGVLTDGEIAGVKDGTVQLKLKSPDHGLQANSVVFAFDQTPFEQGGRYAGEFKVTAVTEGSPEIQLTPNLPLTEAQTQRLAAAKGPWTLYVTMPIDDAAVFAGLDDPTRAALLPPASLNEFAKADRRLYDYETFFHDSYVQRALLADAIAKTSSNLARTEAATKEANLEIGYRTTEKGNLTADLDKFRYEAKAIAAYEKALIKQYQDLRERLKSTYLAARQQAAALVRSQFQAAEEINRRAGGLEPAELPAP